MRVSILVMILSLLGAVGCADGNFDIAPSLASETGVQPQADTEDSDGLTTDGGLSDTKPNTDSTPSDGGSMADTNSVTCGNGRTQAIVSTLDPNSSLKAFPGEKIRFTGRVATSHKFLIRSWGDDPATYCAYGAFISDTNVVFAPYTGIMLVTYGPATLVNNEKKCAGGGPIPDDLKAGDAVDVRGTIENFGPPAAWCASAGMPAPAIHPVMNVCELKVTGTETIPAPALLKEEEINSGDATAWKWAGGLVRTSGTALADSTADGTFRLRTSGLAVVSIAYEQTQGKPQVKAGDVFTQITGNVMLQKCFWSVVPRNPCEIRPIPAGVSGCN